MILSPSIYKVQQQKQHENVHQSFQICDWSMLGLYSTLNSLYLSKSIKVIFESTGRLERGSICSAIKLYWIFDTHAPLKAFHSNMVLTFFFVRLRFAFAFLDVPKLADVNATAFIFIAMQNDVNAGAFQFWSLLLSHLYGCMPHPKRLNIDAPFLYPI